jgi:hypothetical protein
LLQASFCLHVRQGVFAKRHGQELVSRVGVGLGKAAKGAVTGHIATMQNGMRALDNMADDLMREAGVPPGQGSINTVDSAWSAAAWFEAPTQSVRTAFAPPLQESLSILR